MLVTESHLPGSLLNADILISNPCPNELYPYKGIVIELDGPYHYYSPQSESGLLRYTSFSMTRNRLIETMGYKLFCLSVFWSSFQRKGQLFETVAGQDK